MSCRHLRISIQAKGLASAKAPWLPEFEKERGRQDGWCGRLGPGRMERGGKGRPGLIK